METKVTFTNISRKQIEYIVTNGVKALADTKNFETFMLTIDTEGESQSLQIIEER